MGTAICHKTQNKNKVANSVPPNSLAKISVFEDEKIKKISENFHENKNKSDENEKKEKIPILNEKPKENPHEKLANNTEKNMQTNEQNKEIPQEKLISKSISSRENNERGISEFSNQEKSYLSNKMSETNLKNLGGGLIIKIKETGEVVDKYNKTLGYFHDHWRYYYFNSGKCAGWLENEKEIKNGNNLFSGYFDKTGMIFDNRGTNLGKIEEQSGSFRDSKLSFVAKCEGEIKRMALIFYFFHQEFQQKLIY